MIEEPNIIKSRSVSMREQEAAKLKHQQQRKMESRWVEKPTIAGGDIDMTRASTGQIISRHLSLHTKHYPKT